MAARIISAELFLNDPDGTGGTPVPVLEGVQVTEDLEWVPNISAQVTVPAEYAVDARTSPRARLELRRHDYGGQWGVWRLVVRKCTTDHMAGTATMTLESPDILLLGTTTLPGGGAGPFTTLSGAIQQVFNILDPGDVYLLDYTIQPDVTNADTPIQDIVGAAQLPKWNPPESAMDYLTRVAHAYSCRFRMRRQGLLVAYRTGTPFDWSLDESELLSVQHDTDAAKFNNYAVVFDPETTAVLADRRTADPAYHPDVVGRRVNYHEAPSVDLARMDRVMSQGETWQFTALEEFGMEAGDQLTITAPSLGLSFTEEVTSVVHTSDGTMTVNINPPVIGEAVP